MANSCPLLGDWKFRKWLKRATRPQQQQEQEQQEQQQQHSSSRYVACCDAISEAQFKLGECYMHGIHGVEANYDQAIVWLRKSVGATSSSLDEHNDTTETIPMNNDDDDERNQKPSLYHLSDDMDFNCHGNVNDDYQVSFSRPNRNPSGDWKFRKWFKRAQAGNVASQYNVAMCLFFGKHGVVTNQKDALSWFRLANNKERFSCSTNQMNFSNVITDVSIPSSSSPPPPPMNVSEVVTNNSNQNIVQLLFPKDKDNGKRGQQKIKEDDDDNLWRNEKEQLMIPQDPLQHQQDVVKDTENEEIICFYDLASIPEQFREDESTEMSSRGDDDDDDENDFFPVMTTGEASIRHDEITPFAQLKATTVTSPTTAGDKPRPPEMMEADAQYALGNCYQNGTCGVRQDIDKAIYWYQLSAHQGHVDAINCLELLYLET